MLPANVLAKAAIRVRLERDEIGDLKLNDLPGIQVEPGWPRLPTAFIVHE